MLFQLIWPSSKATMDRATSALWLSYFRPVLEGKLDIHVLQIEFITST